MVSWRGRIAASEFFRGGVLGFGCECRRRQVNQLGWWGELLCSALNGRGIGPWSGHLRACLLLISSVIWGILGDE